MIPSRCEQRFPYVIFMFPWHQVSQLQTNLKNKIVYLVSGRWRKTRVLSEEGFLHCRAYLMGMIDFAVYLLRQAGSQVENIDSAPTTQLDSAPKTVIFDGCPARKLFPGALSPLSLEKPTQTPHSKSNPLWRVSAAFLFQFSMEDHKAERI